MRYIIMVCFLLITVAAQALEVNATLEWANRRVAAFAVSGVVAEVNVAVGEPVKKDQLLAQLGQTPFDFAVKKIQAQLEGIKPRWFDAKQNYDQANELFERTVLSQLDLQRALVQLQGVEAEQAAAKAELGLVKWQQKLSVLNAACHCMVIANSLVPGMVINDENQHENKIELAENGIMVAEFIVDATVRLQMKQSVQVTVVGKKYSAVIVAIMTKNDKRMAHAQFQFDPVQSLFSGQSAIVNF